MRWRRRMLVGIALAAVALAACGDDDPGADQGPDLGGWYEVTLHALGAGDCLVEGEDATGLPYVRLEPEVYVSPVDGSESPYFALRRCDAMDATACDDLGFALGNSFIIPIDNGWQERKAGAAWQPGAGDCLLTYARNTVIQNGDGVIVQLRSYRERAAELSEAECRPDAATQRGDSMPCATYEVIHGRPPAP